MTQNLPTTALDAIPVITHYHHAWLVWLIFYTGQGLHAFLQIDSLAQANKVTRREVLQKTMATLLYRMAACTFAFGIIWQYPEILTRLAGALGIQWGSDESSVFALPMNNILALGYGMSLDSLLGYIPLLKSQLPSVTSIQVSQTTTVTQKTETTKTP